MSTGKTTALTRWIFGCKAMSLLFNTLSRFVIAFLPRSKHLLISQLQSPFTVILEPKKRKSVTTPFFSLSFCLCVRAQLLSPVWLLSDPMDCSPPGSSINRISQARILECVAISYTRGIFWTQELDLNICLHPSAESWVGETYMNQRGVACPEKKRGTMGTCVRVHVWLCVCDGGRTLSWLRKWVSQLKPKSQVHLLLGRGGQAIMNVWWPQSQVGHG